MGWSLATALAQRLGSAHQRTAHTGELNYAFVDPYSLAHAAVGAIFALLGLRLGALLAIAIGWELVGARGEESGPGGIPPPYAGHARQFDRRRALGAARLGDRARSVVPRHAHSSREA